MKSIELFITQTSVTRTLHGLVLYRISSSQKLSILGLKNLVHEKTSIPLERMQLYLHKDKSTHTELGETLGPDDVAFLRDFPFLQNGSTLHVVQAS